MWEIAALSNGAVDYAADPLIDDIAEATPNSVHDTRPQNRMRRDWQGSFAHFSQIPLQPGRVDRRCRHVRPKQDRLEILISRRPSLDSLGSPGMPGYTRVMRQESTIRDLPAFGIVDGTDVQVNRVPPW